MYIAFLFTIQNVPIKYDYDDDEPFPFDYLQYKMFLLNKLASSSNTFNTKIYNTKCSY